MSETVEEVIRDIQTRPICQPTGEQYVDRCHYSRTGWAVHEWNGACTCQPAEPPALTQK